MRFDFKAGIGRIWGIDKGPRLWLLPIQVSEVLLCAWITLNHILYVDNMFVKLGFLSCWCKVSWSYVNHRILLYLMIHMSKQMRIKIGRWWCQELAVKCLNMPVPYKSDFHESTLFLQMLCPLSASDHQQTQCWPNIDNTISIKFSWNVINLVKLYLADDIIPRTIPYNVIMESESQM